jgi:pimeloyl-ACP methyl ester carboxylesterase
MLWNILSIAVCIYGAMCLFFFIFQRSFIYMPTPATPVHDAAAVLEVPGARLRLSTRELNGPKALVYFGGNAEDVASTLPELATAFPDRAMYALHYRGYSGSTGHPAEAAMRNDARALFRMVYGLHPDVMAVGRSLGSSLAIQLAAEGPVSRLVLIAPFESILTIASRVAPFLPMRLLLSDPWQSWRYAPRVTCPTLILAASHDEIVPMSDTTKLFEVFRPEVATLRVIDGTDHNSVSGPEEFWKVLEEGW